MPPVLSRRELNRATLERQLLTRRARLPVLDAIEHLAGLQAQVPNDPYTALWSRLENFRPDDVGSLLEERLAVRMPLMRTTVHLVSSTDALRLRPLLQPVLDRVLRSTQFGRDIAGIEIEELRHAARALVEERPRTKKELRELLGPRWPDRPANSLVYAVHYLLPLLQVPPRGVWGRRGEPTWTTLRAWLGREGIEAEVDYFVGRYLAAFGPSSVADAQSWSGLTRLREVFDRLGPVLTEVRDEDGKELFDLPDKPRPGPDVPGPVRFLPEYDNLVLAHADRTRFVGHAPPPGGFFKLVLVDGFCAAHWSVKSGELRVEVFTRLSSAQASELEAEAYALASFLGKGGRAVEVRIVS